MWTSSDGRAKAGWLARAFIQQLYANTGCSPEDLPEAMDDREGWRERVREIHADGATWWWYNNLMQQNDPDGVEPLVWLRIVQENKLGPERKW